LYLLHTEYAHPIRTTFLTLEQFKDVWFGLGRSTRPILAIMVMYGDLQVAHSDLLMSFTGNLPAYCLQFLQAYFVQASKEFPYHPRVNPKEPVLGIVPNSSRKQKQSAWNDCLADQLQSFQDHWTSVQIESEALFQLMLRTEQYQKKFVGRTIYKVCNNFDFLMIYREAIRVDNLFLKKQLPILLFARQLRSLPFTFFQEKEREEIRSAILEYTVRTPSMLVEPFDIFQA